MLSPVSACCGLYCASCRVYLETARGTPLPGEDGPLVCGGCRSDANPPWCAECGLKACARRKGVEFCDRCGEYPCDAYVGFRDDPRYPYHVEAPEHLRAIAERGEAAWLREMEAKWRCGACGEPRAWFDQACTRCGRPLPGFARPPTA